MKHIYIVFLLTLLNITLLYGQSTCDNAVEVPIETYGTCGRMAMVQVDLEGAVPSSDTPLPTCGNFNTMTNDLWYYFTVPAGVTEMAFHAFNARPSILGNPPTTGPGMAIYTGTCGNLTLVDCLNAPDNILSSGEIRWEVRDVPAGDNVYIRLWEEDNDPSRFFFVASEITSLPEADCNTPPELTNSGCNILAPSGTIPAPEECGWNTTDNVVFYNFTVTPDDPQPVNIQIEYGECWANEGGIFNLDNAEIQFAVYSWDGHSCTGIGGGPNSTDNPNNTTYFGCANGTGVVTYEETLPPGQYILAMDGLSTTTGNSLCTFGIASSIVEPDPEPDPDPTPQGNLSVTLSTTDAGCGQQGSAEIRINSSCSNNPTISWSNGATGTTAQGLVAGSYSVTVDDSGTPPCSDTVISFNIAANTNFVTSITTTGNPCNGPVTLTANIMGANPADVNFTWNTNPPQHTQSITVNTAGTYSVTATYGTCSDEDEVTVQSGDFDFDVVYTPTICEGGSGSAQVNIIEGTGPYMYEWSYLGQISPGIEFFDAGNFAVTVSDLTTGCQGTYTFTVEMKPAVQVNILSKDISCYGQADGWAAAHAEGGEAPYHYLWTTTIAQDSITHLISGTYGVTVTDVNNCTGTASVHIGEPTRFSYTITPSQGMCYGEQVHVAATATGGIPPYEYTWDDSHIGNVPELVVSPEVTTAYSVTVTDANGCTSTPQSTTVVVSQPIVIKPIVNNVKCNGECTGTVHLNVTGGIPPFEYSWANNVDYMENQCAGDYTISITDLYGCVGDTTYTIEEPDTMYVTITSGNATCNGYTDGFVDVDVYGGVPYNGTNGDFYNYRWNNDMTQDSMSVGAGFYTVTVNDANGCKQTISATVNEPAAIRLTDPWSGTICIGEEFYTYVHATGGFSPYDFVWVGSDNTQYYGEELRVSPEVTTSYTIYTTDRRGCVGEPKTAVVKVHPAIDVTSISPARSEICKGEAVHVEMEYKGGNGGPYYVTLKGGRLVNMPLEFYPDTTGYYTFVVADDCGSPVDDDSIFVVVHPLPPVAFATDHTEACPPSTFSFTEPSKDTLRKYLWDFGDGNTSTVAKPQHTYKTAGSYDVSLTLWSDHNCHKTTTYRNLIDIHPMPKAAFIASPEVVSILIPQVEIDNCSEGGNKFFWNFGDSTSYQIDNMDRQYHTYSDIGSFKIMLIATNDYDCRDTAYSQIHIHDEYTFYAPDAFSPNNDGVNDFFYVTGNGIDKKDFDFQVFDRFGNRVFRTNVFDAERPSRMAWDGTFHGKNSKGDKILANGIYTWFCSFNDYLGRPHKKSGTVILIK